MATSPAETLRQLTGPGNLWLRTPIWTSGLLAPISGMAAMC